jgi:hypothetical protein
LNEAVRDPQNNLLFEAHCYFDKDGSGSYKKSYDEEGGSPELASRTHVGSWNGVARRGVRGFIGEYVYPTPTRDGWLQWIVFLRTYSRTELAQLTGPAARGGAIMSSASNRATLASRMAWPLPGRSPQMLILRQYPLAATTLQTNR